MLLSDQVINTPFTGTNKKEGCKNQQEKKGMFTLTENLSVM